MNWLDIAILVLMLIGTIAGLLTGIIRAILSLAGFVAGFILAGHYYLPFSERLSFIPQVSVARGVAFAIILIAVMVVAALLALLLERITSAVMLGWVNRLGGAVFGLVTTTITCAALLALWLKFSGTNNAINGSTLSPILLSGFSTLLALIPEGWDAVRSFFQDTLVPYW
jgi:membrane protein required for colicin V production